MKENKFCDNCRHYVKYYFWFKSKLMYARKGRCNIAKKSMNLFDCDGTCEKWETDSDKQEAQAETFEQVLRQMARRIEEIAYLLHIAQAQNDITLGKVQPASSVVKDIINDIDNIDL